MNALDAGVLIANLDGDNAQHQKAGTLVARDGQGQRVAVAVTKSHALSPVVVGAAAEEG